MNPNQAFGQQVKQRRKALDLTQAVLAYQVGCSISTIEKIESDQRRPSKQIIERLADALALHGADRAEFLRAARPMSTALPPPSNLPMPRTSFIGREQEKAAVRALLQRPEVRVLTLTGPGGIGKTRLALHAISDLQFEFAHGARFIGLAALNDPALVLPMIARGLGLSESQDQSLGDLVAAHLREKQLLLLLDNFEHLLAAAPDIGALLAAAPGVKLLSTSRALLHIPGEHEFPVPALALPNLRRLPPPYVLAEIPAVALFVARAQSAQPDFNLTAENLPTVAAICVQLEGLPLAIELAAAHTRLLPPTLLLERLKSRLRLLIGRSHDLPTRHQSIRAAIAWSLELLDSDVQTLFARLGVFSGGCTFEAVEAVCGEQVSPSAPSAVAPGLLLTQVGVLLDHNLLGQEQGVEDAPRFLMLEVIHEYALELLAAHPAARALQERHATYYCELAEQAAPEMMGSQQQQWIERLEQDHDNFRAALHWALAHDEVALAARIAGGLAEFWFMHGYLKEGRQWLHVILERSSLLPIALQAKILCGAGWFAWNQGDLEFAYTALDQSLNHYRELDDPVGTAMCLNHLGTVALLQGSYELAGTRYAESLALRRTLGDKQQIADTLNNLGLVAGRQGDYASARALLEESLVYYQELGNKLCVATNLNNLGGLSQWMEEYETAAAYFRESLALSKELGDKLGMVDGLANLGSLAEEQRDYPAARELLEQALELSRELGEKPAIANTLYNLGNVSFYQHDLPGARAQYAEGLRLACEQGEPRQLIYGIDRIAGIMAHTGSGHNTEQMKLAVRLLAATKALGASNEVVSTPEEGRWHEQIIAIAHAGLDGDTFAAAWAEGQGMTMEQAINQALAERALLPARSLSSTQLAGAPMDQHQPAGQTVGLTTREAEIVRLVAQGLTDRQIGAQLTISPRTVDTHLRRIFSKVQVTSRAGLAVWAVRHNVGATHDVIAGN